MCGIVAAFSYKNDKAPLESEDIIRIRDRMTPRGPDAAGNWLSEDRRVALAHRRLAIIDLSPRGAQPMVAEASGTRITFNGEIYNYRALRHELEQQGCLFHSDSDTEVLLQAYDRYGPAMVERLRGMYAFAIWDSAKRGLFLARDPFGIKPLYYSDDGGRVLVASQVKALLMAKGIDRTPDPAGKAGFLVMGSVIEPHTLYKSIRALPAGSTLWIDAQGVRPPHRFWSAGAVLARAAEEGGGARRAELRELLQDSIRHHMVADVPVGLFLSGGLDSTTLLALAAESGFEQLQTATLGFDAFRNTPYDEVALAERTAELYGAPHASRRIGVESFVEEREKLIDAMDQPSIDGVNVYFVAKAAAQSGLKVALSGLGGDELFAGYPSFRQIPRLAAAMSPFAGLPGLGRGLRTLAAPLLRRLTSPKYASILEYGTTIEDAYLLRRGLFLPWELPSILDPEEAREGWRELGLADAMRSSIAGIAEPRDKVAALEIDFYMRNQLLRDSDWAGMAHSLEIRLPLVDVPLFEGLASLGRFSKRDMADTPERKLPAEILGRPKSGFTVPVRSWLMHDLSLGALRGDRGLRGWARYLLDRHLGAR